MMQKVLNDKLVHQILSVVSCIPLGSVATYGQIAQLIGRERNARLVGRVLSQAGLYGKYPCHRVVNSAGRLAPAWEEQRHLLWAEGVTFRTNGCVDLKKHQWRPTDISKV
ncbi:DNA methyltransferase protein [Streptococcus milleri]|nr:DNA methyltransferase protein [Streptococcus milleri]